MVSAGADGSAPEQLMTSLNRTCAPLCFSAWRSGLLSMAVVGIFGLGACGDGRDTGAAGIPDTNAKKVDKKKSKSGDSKKDSDTKDDDDASGIPDDNDSGKGVKKDGPDEGSEADQCDKIDFVFVIDDSRSMAADQLGLISEFPNFIKVLNAYRTKDGRPLDYRIAVTTSSISYEITSENESYKGDDGLFRTTNSSADGRSCWSEKRRWIERSDKDLTERFSCAAQVGVNGLGHEMQMLALNMSLENRVASGDHEGFLRDDALLAAVILTDEDDCSTEDQKVADLGTCSNGPSSFPDSLMKQSQVLARLDAVKGKSRERWALGVLSKYICLPNLKGGWVPVEAPKQRLKGLVSEAGENAVYVQVCDDKYAKHLNTVLNTFTEACENFPPPI